MTNQVNTLIVAGVPRSGKSMIRLRLAKKYGIGGFSTDWLRDGLEIGAPDFGIKQGQSDRQKAELLWPYFQGILETRQYYHDLIIIEGVNFLPKYLNQVKDKPYIRICFVGYPNISPQAKLNQIKKHNSQDDNWHEELSDKQLLEMIQIWISDSKHFQSECQKYQIPFFDISDDFIDRLGMVERFLVNNISLK